MGLMRIGGIFKFFYAKNIISRYPLMQNIKQKFLSASCGKEGARESKKPLSSSPLTGEVIIRIRANIKKLL